MKEEYGGCKEETRRGKDSRMLFLILLFFCLKSITLINDGDNIVDVKSQMIYELPTTQKMKHFMAYLCDFNQAEPVG